MAGRPGAAPGSAGFGDRHAQLVRDLHSLNFQKQLEFNRSCDE